MEFYTYNSTAQKEHFNEIDVFTADKNTLQFSATVYWFIRYIDFITFVKENLGCALKCPHISLSKALYTRHFHTHRELAVIALIPTSYFHIFTVSFIICNI